MQNSSQTRNAETRCASPGRYPPQGRADQTWLTKVGYERMQEMADLALWLDRAARPGRQHGSSDKWIQQRMTGQETRKTLHDTGR